MLTIGLALVKVELSSSYSYSSSSGLAVLAARLMRPGAVILAPETVIPSSKQ